MESCKTTPAKAASFALPRHVTDETQMTLTSNPPSDTPCVQVLTPPGAGAVAVIEIAGLPSSSANAMLKSFASPAGHDMSKIAVSRILFGSWRGEDAVVTRVSDSTWEIHCHGGAVAVKRILDELFEAGGSLAQNRPAPGEIANPLPIAVSRTLPACRTRKTAGLALAQLGNSLNDLVLHLDSPNAAERAAAVTLLNQWRPAAEHLTKAWRIAFIGAPNVGKSSLLNQIAGMQRSIVSSTAGTTRDIVELEVQLSGWMFQFVDTAGIRSVDSSSIEHLGILQTKDALQNCDLVCLILDAHAPALTPEISESLSLVHVPFCVLWNKMDLLTESDRPSLGVSDNTVPANATQHFVSARTGSGLAQFFDWLISAVLPEEPTADSPLPLPELHLKFPTI